MEYTLCMRLLPLVNQTKKPLLLLGLFMAGPLFMAFTNPESLPLPLLVLPFMWLFSCLFITVWLVLSKKPTIQRKQIAIVSGLVATIPVLLIVFQSIHLLSIRDVVISVGLALLASGYVLRADFIK